LIIADYQRIRGVLVHDDALYKSTFYLPLVKVSTGVRNLVLWN